MNKMWWFYFLFFFLWLVLPLPGCALLTPPSEEELRRWVMTEEGIDGRIVSEKFQKNPFVNQIFGRFVICTKDGRQLRALASLSRNNGFRISKSGTGVPCTAR
ncbi:hypothetical protein A2661_01630 [Candidatus Giovannonibacteria bacterium RIFCSPHIGHO2_01_FULL_45_24]|uniref:Uncharacterized protein n=1 Tax=Candidatus Giovannonibacteria bacterium RIFCSPLOWO2_01_FULL_46_32 TaxID=1798353 RepID=A0A1F5XH74_9BACT|nr:MAG: hypothetical protein A2661_01630 [Candidatus Giovannonibacteria bacterium RIFCSPHIGHO2_01_FULL_45_24]OGF87268.1 MAG: hypothetical protein A3B19_03505 [Candidatus Giovannonibacteria bacterium RIFCSPLOWO2_01_FULL_46_32]